jgi:hypothetical protein
MQRNFVVAEPKGKKGGKTGEDIKKPHCIVAYKISSLIALWHTRYQEASLHYGIQDIKMMHCIVAYTVLEVEKKR